jgi:hypothetical protein
VPDAPRVTLSKDCLGGDRVVDVELPRVVEAADLDRVDGVGTRTVLVSLPRPFFRLDVPGRFLLTGIVGEARVRFTVRRALRESAVDVALGASHRMLGA